MSYRIAQDFRYMGRDYWKWRVWIEAEEEALDAIDYVEWILHPTFPKPRVTSRARRTGFRLSSAGWGTVHLKDGNTEELRHILRLEYPDDSTDGEAAPAERSKPLKVFLSYGSEDARRAAGLKRELEDRGVSVLDASSISEASVPVEAAVRRSIRNSDAVVGVIGEDTASPFLIDELEFARKAGRQVMMLNRPGMGKAFGVSPGLVSYGTSLELDTDQVTAENVVQALSKLEL